LAQKRIGVLALQGDVREHVDVLRKLDCEVVEVKTPAQLASVQALVIPGGESTTIFKLAEIFDMLEPLRAAISAGLPVLGTCAGLILLSKTILDPASGQESFGGLDVVVRRNAFGNQNDSFETELVVTGIGGLVHAAFIRAPIIDSVGEGVEIISTLPDGRIVGVRQGKAIGISFHPEVVGDSRVHELLLELVN
jgi:5'-phosphate synthase pdxT subunit